MMTKFFAIVTALFVSMQAHADLLLEPILGYNATVTEFTVSGVDAGTAAKGFMMGGRVGYSTMGIFIAGEYTFGDMDWESENPTIRTSGKLTRTGITAGWDLPMIPLRPWVGYYKTNFSTTGGGHSFDFEDGKGFKLGLGFTLLPIIDINLEYFTGKYDTFKEDAVTQGSAKDHGIFLSLSAPFVL